MAYVVRLNLDGIEASLKCGSYAYSRIYSRFAVTLFANCAEMVESSKLFRETC